MAHTKNIQVEIQEVLSLKTLSEVYGEIAAIRMKKIREFVLRNREFIASIESIFKDSLAEYAKKLSQKFREGKLKTLTKKMTLLAHNGKTVAVLISANTGFYGEVVKETFKVFLGDIRKKDYEVTIIGRLGRNLFLEEEPKRPYTYFELPDYGFDSLKMSEVLKHLVPYEEIVVYFGKYQSIITQKVTTSVISAGTPISGEPLEPKVKYIFEPTVEKILIFFETQIFASLFDQSVRESQLAKFASRILSMDNASNNIKRRLKELEIENLKSIHRIENNKQLNSLSPTLQLLKY